MITGVILRVFQLSGLVVGGIGIWTVLAKHSYVSLMATSTYPILAYALVAAGALAVIGSWLGCGGVTSENRCVILIVSTFLIYHMYMILSFLFGCVVLLFSRMMGRECKKFSDHAVLTRVYVVKTWINARVWSVFMLRCLMSDFIYGLQGWRWMLSFWYGMNSDIL